MVKVLDIVQPREGKEGKTYWQKLGVKFVSDDGKESIKLDDLPLPNEKGEVWMNIFEQRPRDDAGANGTWDKPDDTPADDGAPADTASKDFDDEIPF